MSGRSHRRSVPGCETAGSETPYSESPLARSIHSSRGRRMVHANENRGRHDDRLPPGDGEIDWARLLAQLNHLHFAGTLILEIADLGGPAAGTKIDGSHA